MSKEIESLESPLENFENLLLGIKQTLLKCH